MATCIGIEGSPKLVFLFIHDDNEHIELKCRWICKCLMWGLRLNTMFVKTRTCPNVFVFDQ
jgi:hypothetical protein